MSLFKDFSRRDALLISALVTIAVLAWINFRNDSKKNKTRNTFHFGKVIKLEGREGKHLIASDFFWTEVQEGESFGANDSFMTGPNTTAEIQIGSNRIILKPNTLIKLIKEDVIRFNDGQILVLGSDVKIKTNSAVHKVSGEVVLVTNSEKDKITVTEGEHTIIPEQEFVVETKYIPPPPLAANYFMEANWLKKEGLPGKVFFQGETITVAEWIAKVQESKLLSEKMYIEGREIDAQFFMPLLSFEKEFQIINERFLINKRRLNGTLIVNGLSYDANQAHKIELKIKKNHITLLHAFQKREYTYYIDEDAEDINVEKTEYELTKAQLPLTPLTATYIPKDESVEEEEEEEQKGAIRLEWESRLKDNQIFLIRIKDTAGDTLVEDFAEDRHYLWTPSKPGNYQLEISIKSTVTEKILKTTSKEITISKATPVVTQPLVRRPSLIAAGLSLISSNTKNDSETVETRGISPLSLRLATSLRNFAFQAEGTLFLADVPTEKSDKFLNSKFQMSFEKGHLIPMIAYQNTNIIISNNQELNLASNSMYLGGLAYRLNWDKFQLMPFCLYNVGTIPGTQFGVESFYELATNAPLRIILRGELNDQKNDEIKNTYSQITLLLGISL
jgi:hypothetical protein